MPVSIVHGDLLEQEVDVIVNPWNRNYLPWRLLWPQGVSGAIRKRGRAAPFRELARQGPIPLGGAVLTTAGDLPFSAIIHVAGINLFCRASEASTRDSVRNALVLAEKEAFPSLALDTPSISCILLQRYCDQSKQVRSLKRGSFAKCLSASIDALTIGVLELQLNLFQKLS